MQLARARIGRRTMGAEGDEEYSCSHGYKVGFPPEKGLLAEISDGVKETFFADEPLREYKGQPRSKKLWLGLQHVFPVLDWGRHYTLGKLKGDLVAGITIASLCIPQDIAYAKMAHLPPHIGLYSSFVPPLIYALMGTSRDLAVGPAAVVSLLIGTLLQSEIDPVKNPLEYSRLAFTATFFAGITQALLGFFRLGFIVEFISHAALVGFMSGAAITIALQQLKGFLGIVHFTSSSDIISVMKSIWENVHHGWNWQTILIGASFLAFLLATKYIAKKNKKLFWVSSIAPLISVIVSTFFVYITRADKHGVVIIKDIKQGINPPSFHLIYFSGPYLMKGFRIGVITGMVALTDAIAFGRVFASMKDYQIDGNKEMVALGTMNIVGSMTSCYVATGSLSRSAVNYMAGCKTTVSNVVMALVVVLTLVLITPLFKYTPIAILSSIIISVVVSLIDYESVQLIWKVDKMDFVACLGAFLGVIFASVEYGLLAAVAISFAKILLHVTRPRTALLGNLPRTFIYMNAEQYPEAIKVPGVLIVRVDSAIYFTNSNYVKERILRWLRDEDEQQKEQGLPETELLIVELSAVTDIDTSGIHALEELLKALEKRQIQLILANPGPTVIRKLRSAKFMELIGDDKIVMSAGDAVKKFALKPAENV
ncbi:sulfate transporter 1.2 isoform X1 [Brachypodium distachyon]|nr:sulfate transporter 1.2 isoform X1 [Brachypodium distachyon]|eukprot:XP_014752774.2 sulfate transporter 1.2 isoform X1 [Brachypodium distachyon]